MLTSFFSWSNSIFKISLSDISRAILAAGRKHFCSNLCGVYLKAGFFSSYLLNGATDDKQKVLAPRSSSTVSSSCPVASSHCRIRAAPLLFIQPDPGLRLLDEIGNGLHLMSPIPRDELKQSGAVTSGQEAGGDRPTDGKDHLLGKVNQKVTNGIG